MVRHYFLPHKKKRIHQKAHLLSHRALGVYIAVFIFIQILFVGVKTVSPGILGTTSEIKNQEIINLTNTERQKYGVPPLKENSLLDKAAEEKAKNMFAENYWAHVSPSGKSPWVWIQGAGYNYKNAGENLAKNFSTSTGVMDAWMASKIGHRENVLGAQYQEIGVAVEDGVINGEKTTLVVQLFGTPLVGARPKAGISNEGAATIANNNIQPTVNGITTQNAIKPANAPVYASSLLSQFIPLNSYALTRMLALSLIGFLSSLALIDLYVMWRRGLLIKLHLRHLPHLSVIFAAAIVVFLVHAGNIV